MRSRQARSRLVWEGRGASEGRAGAGEMGGTPHFPVLDSKWPQVVTSHVFAIRGWKPKRFRKSDGRWKDMPVYLSNDHLITRNTSTPGAPWRNQKRDFQKKLDFKVELRHRQRTDRPSQPPSSCGKFVSRGRACQPPHSNVCIVYFLLLPVP